MSQQHTGRSQAHPMSSMTIYVPMTSDASSPVATIRSTCACSCRIARPRRAASCSSVPYAHLKAEASAYDVYRHHACWRSNDSKEGTALIGRIINSP